MGPSPTYHPAKGGARAVILSQNEKKRWVKHDENIF